MAVAFSLVVTVYNKAPYLRQCVGSVLNQSYSEFEVIIIDDGSTDDSLDILRTYDDPRITLISVTNGGVSQARNIGLSKAKNDYITFIDGDDYISCDYLKRFSKEIEAYGCDVLIGGVTKFDSGKSLRVVKSSFPAGIVPIQNFKSRYVDELVNNEGIFGYVAAKCVKRSLLTEHKIGFNPDLKLAEDQDFWSHVYLKANSIAISGNAGYMYRQNAEYSSVSLEPQHLSQLGIWLYILENYTARDTEGRDMVLKKLVGISEAHFLELSSPSFQSVNSDFRLLQSMLDKYYIELKHPTFSFLQSLIVRSKMKSVWLYLNLRRLYHRLNAIFS